MRSSSPPLGVSLFTRPWPPTGPSLVELLYAAERLLELSKDEEITSPNIRTIPTAKPDEGVALLKPPEVLLLTLHY